MRTTTFKSLRMRSIYTELQNPAPTSTTSHTVLRCDPRGRVKYEGTGGALLKVLEVYYFYLLYKALFVTSLPFITLHTTVSHVCRVGAL